MRNAKLFYMNGEIRSLFDAEVDKRVRKEYSARAAPGSPKIISGNFPLINLVADTENCTVEGDASSAKKIFCAP